MSVPTPRFDVELHPAGFLTFAVTCDAEDEGCGWRGPRISSDEEELAQDGAVEEWNRRAQSSRERRLEEAVQLAIELLDEITTDNSTASVTDERLQYTDWFGRRKRVRRALTDSPGDRR